MKKTGYKRISVSLVICLLLSCFLTTVKADGTTGLTIVVPESDYSLNVQIKGKGKAIINQLNVREDTSLIFKNGTKLTMTIHPEKDWDIKSIVYNNEDITNLYPDFDFGVMNEDKTIVISFTNHVIPPTSDKG